MRSAEGGRLGPARAPRSVRFLRACARPGLATGRRARGRCLLGARWEGRGRVAPSSARLQS
eukprot:156541-Pyramimonas_sp.AAC.1